MKHQRSSFIALAILSVILPIISALLGSTTALAALDEPARSEVNAVPTGTANLVSAANAFLGTLDEKQRARAVYAFDDKAQRARWSNFPTGFVPRGGVSLHDMSESQRAAALSLVAAALSQKGYEKVQQIMEADEIFRVTNHGPPPFGNDKGNDHGGPPLGPGKPSDHDYPPFGDDQGDHHGPPPFGGGKPGGPGGPGGALFGKDLYYISILGTPSEKDPWMLQYGGHHLALNLTIAGEQGVLTPTLTGAQPATYTVKGKTVRPLVGKTTKRLSCSVRWTKPNANRQS